MTFVIAIDGPAASGKGTLAARLALKYGYYHLDTGLLYRGVAAALLEQNTMLDDEEAAKTAACALDLSKLDKDMLSAHSIGDAASKVAALACVRDALLTVQRIFAEQEPGAVLDGRDIGSVICPNADLKLFVTASANVRAKRRFKQAQGRGDLISYEDILADIIKRDERDQRRDQAPLVAAEDAHLIDTSKMDIETAFQTACGYVEKLR